MLLKDWTFSVLQLLLQQISGLWIEAKILLPRWNIFTGAAIRVESTHTDTAEPMPLVANPTLTVSAFPTFQSVALPAGPSPNTQRGAYIDGEVEQSVKSLAAVQHPKLTDLRAVTFSPDSNLLAINM